MEIKIHNYTWTVQMIQGDSETLHPEPDRYYAGLTEYVEQLISIRAGMSRERTRATVIHELVHAFIDSCGYKADSMDEEEMCKFFEANADEIIRLTNKIMKEVMEDADNG